MTRTSRFLPLVVLLAATTAHAAGLPDTGQDTCYNDTGADSLPPGSLDSIARDTGTHPRQDCRYGRDPAAIAGHLTKTGGGARGFDYTKIANNGSALPAGAALGTANTEWACTRDNVTGLTWEIKNLTSTDRRYAGFAYTWYDDDVTTNGGSSGSQGSNTCNATLPGGLCNTKALVSATNAAQLCTYNNWRMPTRRELFTLYQDGSNANIDPLYFPNTVSEVHWTSSTYLPNTTAAWLVSHFDGATVAVEKTGSYRVRLVRGGPF